MPELFETPETDTTRQRILEAAELVFAEKGFASATVRDILRHAGVSNIAAINYYFGDKERLYAETVKAAHICCNSTVPLPEWTTGVPAEQKLRDFIHVMMQRMFEAQRPTALQLMMREMATPSPAVAEVVRDYVRPMAQVLSGILAELIPDVPEGRRFLFGLSIVGQCLFYRTNRSVLVHLMGEENFEKLDVNRLAAHIADFTLRGLGVSG
jgi:TetR/AcrR family transcriptional regulator, regulator of cefoperazone and chloramphenicol sensitivity